MKILVLNCGSSSLKFQLVETTPEWIAGDRDRLVARGGVERIGAADSIVSFETPTGEKLRFSRPILTHKDGIKAAFDCLTEMASSSIEEIEGVGHRIVHGGEHFRYSALMDEDVVRRIESCIELAPLHNPHNLKGYYASKALLPGATHVAVFDTAFHQTLPPKAYLYGLPYVYYTRDKVRRYGFHGSSHRYVCHRFARIRGSAYDRCKLITCHLGNGCSVCAVENGRSVDTSMGFTPLEGLIMGTRAGDLDPGAVLYLVGREEMGLHEVDVLLNKHSGLFGISGVSNDMRDLLEECDKGNERASLAVDAFCYRLTKYIGAYFAVMDGADAVIFTGGIGENAPAIRSRVCASLGAIGIRLDPSKNESVAGREQQISEDAAPTGVWVIPTNEELLIAHDTLRAILKIPQPELSDRAYSLHEGGTL